MNGHIGGRTNQNRDDFSSVRVGAYGIRPTNEHIGGRTDQNRDDFSSVRVGAYGIRHKNRHIGGRMNQKKTGSVVHLFMYDEVRADRYVRLLFSKGTMGAYAIRPYPDEQKGGVFFVRRRSEKGWLGGCALLLFVGKMKIGGVFLVSLSPFLVLTGGKETKESQAPAGGVFFVRRRSRKGWLGGDGLLLFVGKMKIGDVWVQIFLRDRERANQYVPLLFFDGTMGAYAIRPYPDGQKGGVFFVRCRSGTG